MHFHIPAVVICLALIVNGLSIPNSLHSSQHDQRSRLPLPSVIDHQFPVPTWLENLAVRSNGEILLGLGTAPSLYLVSPLVSAFAPSSPNTATLLHTFPSNALLGIAETSPDQFYAVASNFNLSADDFALGSNSIWSINLKSYNQLLNHGAVITKVTSLPDAQFLNGLAALDPIGHPHLLVSADSILGAIWLVDTSTGAHRILLQEPEMAPPAVAGALGANGLKVLPHATDKDLVYVYFTNTYGLLFGRVPLSLSKLTKAGPVETLFSGRSADDFALDVQQGVAYLASGTENAVFRVSLQGGPVTTVLGGVNDTMVEGATSVALGRGLLEEGWAYVSTNGGLLAPVNGVDVGGRLVAVNIGREL